ncbi:uncharacterized protein LOC117584985 isoform X10 [Drosophila guanche]|nr:uncharacterized protein LOC117584985 isoform X10 [Drosophila guanche]
MTRFRIKNLKILSCCWLSVWVTLFGGALHLARCSEFPERECCDLTTTSTVGPLPMPPAALPTDKSLSSATTALETDLAIGRSGSTIKGVVAILNCILARQLCFEDPSCSAILEIIPRVCGPIPVSCSTVTVTKCQAALRTLQAFQFFRPTCLCKEPGMDPDCNHFRDFLFDHPCGFVLKKAEKDPYPIDALPTCNHALSVCQQERKCLKLFEDFKTHCKVRDNKCKMENRDACHDSWTNLRLSPMFGCICPNNHMKKRCDRIFNIVNHNPCVDRIIFFPNGLPKMKQPKPKAKAKPKPKPRPRPRPKPKQKHPHSLNGTTELMSNNIEYHDEPNNEAREDPENGNQEENETDDENVDADGTDDGDEEDSDDDDYDDRIRAEIYSNYPHYLHPPSWGINNPLVLASHSPHTLDDDDVVVEVATTNHHKKPTHSHMDDLERSSVDDVVVVVDAGPHLHSHQHPHTYYTHGEQSFTSTIGSAGPAPTIPSPPNTGTKLHKTALLGDLVAGSDITHRTYTGPSMDERGGQDVEVDLSTEIIKQHFQSTCHTALDTCREDPSCSSSLQPMLMHCELHRCNRNACMTSLQAFYKGPHEDLNLDIAFCLCK